MVHANKVEKSDLEIPKLLYFALDRKIENLGVECWENDKQRDRGRALIKAKTDQNGCVALQILTYSTIDAGKIWGCATIQ